MRDASKPSSSLNQRKVGYELCGDALSVERAPNVLQASPSIW